MRCCTDTVREYRGEDLPERFGNFRVVHLCHIRWSKAAYGNKVLVGVLSQDADNEYAMIDSTIVRAHQHSSGAKKEGSRTQQGELSIKMYLLADGLGGPLRIVLTAGSCSDLDGEDRLLPHLKDVVYLDESGFRHDWVRNYGYVVKGKPCVVKHNLAR